MSDPVYSMPDENVCDLELLDNCRVIEQPEFGDPPAHVMAFVEKIDRLHARAELKPVPTTDELMREFVERESYAESKRGFGGNTTPKRAPR